MIITAPTNNFPYVAMEAKSFGIPVLSCSKGDISKIIKNNIDGHIVSTNSVHIMINLLNKIIKIIINIQKILLRDLDSMI